MQICPELCRSPPNHSTMSFGSDVRTPPARGCRGVGTGACVPVICGHGGVQHANHQRPWHGAGCGPVTHMNPPITADSSYTDRRQVRLATLCRHCPEFRTCAGRRFKVIGAEVRSVRQSEFESLCPVPQPASLTASKSLSVSVSMSVSVSVSMPVIIGKD